MLQLAPAENLHYRILPPTTRGSGYGPARQQMSCLMQHAYRAVGCRHLACAPSHVGQKLRFLKVYKLVYMDMWTLLKQGY